MSLFQCVAWANVNCKGTPTTKTAAYSCNGTSAVAILENHGYLPEHCIEFTVSGGSLLAGVYTVTSVTYSSFTFNTTATASNGTITLNSVPIRASGNIHSVIKNQTPAGIHTVNFATQLVDANYSTIMTTDVKAHHCGRYDSYLSSTPTRFSIWTVDANNGWADPDFLNIAVFR